MTLNFIPDTIRKIVAGFTDKVLSRFKTNTPGNYSKQNAYEPGKKPNILQIQKQSENNIISSIRNLLN